jgi:hypothetical protein
MSQLVSMLCCCPEEPGPLVCPNLVTADCALSGIATISASAVQVYQSIINPANVFTFEWQWNMVYRVARQASRYYANDGPISMQLEVSGPSQFAVVGSYTELDTQNSEVLLECRSEVGGNDPLLPPRDLFHAASWSGAGNVPFIRLWAARPYVSGEICPLPTSATQLQPIQNNGLAIGGLFNSIELTIDWSFVVVPE